MKNQFFDAELADQIAEQDRIELLVRKIEEDPAVLETLEICELLAVNHYYEEIIRKNEEGLEYLKNAAS